MINNEKRVALIDADVLAYRIGAMTHEESEWKIIKFEVDFYLKNVILAPIQATHYMGFFTGAGNFRKQLTEEFNTKLVDKPEEVATTKPYKGSRTDTRPYWHKEICQYLCEVWGFVFVEGMEADDALSICQRKNSIICSNDHDFKQVPGYHYDYTKRPEERKLVYISPEEAHYNLWKQVITGCNTDEVEGIKGFGPASAEKYLANLKPEEYPEAVQLLYRSKYGESGNARFDLTVQLITLRRGKGYMEIPPLRAVPTEKELEVITEEDEF